MAGETTSISELLGLNSPRGPIGNSSREMCTPPNSPSYCSNLQLNFVEPGFYDQCPTATSTPVRTVQRNFSLGSAGTSPSTPPSFYNCKRNLSYSGSHASNSPTVPDSPFQASGSECNFTYANSPASDYSGAGNQIDVPLSDLLDNLNVNDHVSSSAIGLNSSTDLTYLQNLQALYALKYLQQPSHGQVLFPNNGFNASICPINPNISEGNHLDRAARYHQSAASAYDALCTWSGTLPIVTEKPTGFSSKVFLGGVPWDITDQCLIDTFKQFGPVKVEWPCKDKETSQRKGYAYIIFEAEKQVKMLLQSCNYHTENWYFKIGSRKMKTKDVQVIPWPFNNSNFTKSSSQKLDPNKTVFVGGLHGTLNALGLATVMNDLFDGVVYAGIDTDKHKYPIGSGRVTFNNPRSFMRAIAAGFVEIKTEKFTKKVQVKPYLEDSLCTICYVQQGPYFCRNILCFRYFCHSCWDLYHIHELKHHYPTSRNSKNGQRTITNRRTNFELTNTSGLNNNTIDFYNSSINNTAGTDFDFNNFL